jgi:hypothetical protein
VKFHRHQDGYVYVRDADDNVIYAGTVEEFQQDRGTVLPPLPAGMVASIYDSDAKVMTYYDRKGNAHPVEGQCIDDYSEQTIQAKDALCATQSARVAAAEAAATVTKMPVV